MLRSELVSALNQYPDIEVVVDGYESGTEPITVGNISKCLVDKAAGDTYGGKYGDGKNTSKGMKEPAIVICISRWNHLACYSGR